MAKLLNDVSFAGSSVNISGVGDIRDFMDDANPVEFQDCEVSAVGVNCNGQMIRYAKPSAVMMSVTVIPGSGSDKALWALWKKYRIKDSWDMQWETDLSATVTVQNGHFGMSRTLTGGTMVSGPGGPTSNGEGKLQGRTYTFAFVKPS